MVAQTLVLCTVLTAPEGRMGSVGVLVVSGLVVGATFASAPAGRRSQLFPGAVSVDRGHALSPGWSQWVVSIPGTGQLRSVGVNRAAGHSCADGASTADKKHDKDEQVGETQEQAASVAYSGRSASSARPWATSRSI